MATRINYLIDVSCQPLVQTFDGLFDLIEASSEPEALSAKVSGHQRPAGILAQGFCRTRMSALSDEPTSSQGPVVVLGHVLDVLRVLGAQGDLSRR